MVFGNKELYEIRDDRIYIRENTVYGVVYDFSDNILPYRDNIAIYLENGEIEKKIQIAQLYTSSYPVYIMKNEIDMLDFYVFERFDIQTILTESIDELYTAFSENEKSVILNRQGETIKQYYEEYLNSVNKIELAREKKSQLLEIRTLKQFKFSEEKYTKAFKIKLLKFVLKSLEDKALSVVDEIAFRDYQAIFLSDALDYSEMKLFEGYITFDVYQNLLREYNFYTHDYLSDFHSIKNLRLLGIGEKIEEFLTKRLYLTLNIAFTKDGLGRENTPVYYRLLESTTLNIINELNNESMNMLRQKLSNLQENLKWFEINKGRYVNFGDSNHLVNNYVSKIVGRKLFEDTGYAVQHWSDNSHFFIKYKTLSVVHSHCDDGSFIYSYKGEPIFIDPGLYKYSEGDSARKFVRSLRAHNLITLRDENVIGSNVLNTQLLGQSEYKKLRKRETDGFVSLNSETWEQNGKIKLNYNWLKDVRVTREFEILSESNFTITENIQLEEEKVLQFRFNLDEKFNTAEIVHDKQKKSLIIWGDRFRVEIKFNMNLNFAEANSYKCLANEKIKKIRQLVFFRKITVNETIKFTFDIKDNIVKPKETKPKSLEKSEIIPPNVEKIDGKEIRYLYFKKDINPKKNLLIVFQSVMVPCSEFYEAKGQKNFKQIMEDKICRHSFFYFKENDKIEADILYVEDNNSNYYGWYLLDNNEFVNKKYVKFLDEFIKKNGYHSESVYAFGSSKGAFASLLLGIEAENVGNVYSIVPQISLVKYFSGNNYNHFLYEEMLGGEYNNIYKADVALYFLKNTKTKIKIFSGIGDSQYKELIRWIEEQNKMTDLLEIELKIDNRKLTHNDIFRQNIKMIEEILTNDLREKK